MLAECWGVAFELEVCGALAQWPVSEERGLTERALKAAERARERAQGRTVRPRQRQAQTVAECGEHVGMLGGRLTTRGDVSLVRVGGVAQISACAVGQKEGEERGGVEARLGTQLLALLVQKYKY